MTVGCAEPCIEQTTPTSIQEIENLDHIEFCSQETKLVGKLVIPEGEGSFPLLVFAHGSGESATRNTYDPIVNLLKAEGYVCFIPDKRGVGDSGGSIPDVGEGDSTKKIQLLADDLLAAVNFMKDLKEINTEQIGLIGGSQAGWVIALAAAQSNIPDFTVIVNGATVSVGVQMFWEGITEELMDEDRRGHLIPMGESKREELSRQISGFDGKHGFDPRESIEMMSVPGIWLWGDLDPNVPTRECKAILEEIIAEYGKPYTIYYEDTSGHNWPDSKENKIIDWLNEQTSNQ